MANTTFEGPVRSTQGFLQWDGAEWVPVSGGGGGVSYITTSVDSGLTTAPIVVGTIPANSRIVGLTITAAGGITPTAAFFVSIGGVDVAIASSGVEEGELIVLGGATLTPMPSWFANSDVLVATPLYLTTFPTGWSGATYRITVMYVSIA